MEVSENKRVVYEFGGFVLDPDQRRLARGDTPIHLPAKEFDTLVLLVEHNGLALSKEEMIAAIWQDAFVEEGNLAKQISRLRKVLGSNGEVRIETVPKHGYRFTAELHKTFLGAAAPVIVEKRIVRRMTVGYEPGEGNSGPPSEERLLQGASRRPGRLGFGFAAGGAMLILAAAAYLLLFRNAESAPASLSAVTSVAVLPFKSVASESNDEYIRLGLTDALITKLGNIKKIVVRPTSAVRQYGLEDPVAAGRKLGVNAVLDGNVQRDGDQIRVTVQLISIPDGKVLWGDRFDEKFSDIFTVQDAISAQVARALVPGLTGEETSLLAKRYTVDPEAHNAYVRGRFFWNRRTAADLKEAVRHFHDAVEKDPNYALAYVGLADTYSLLADYNAAAPSESYGKAREAALRALDLDDSLAEAHTSLAYVNMYYFWDWQNVESGFRRAISLNPNYATARQWYSEYLAATGRFDEALAEIRRAREIDPLSPVINAGEVWILYFARRYDEAIEQGRKLAELNPEFAEIHEYLKRCYDQKGMYREAINARQTRRRLAGADPTVTPALRSAASAASGEAYWSKRLEQEETDSQSEGVEHFDMAEILAQLGETDRAFEHLENAYANRSYELIYLKVAPNLDRLRPDPRFADMLKRVGLSP
jgi:TolB-like protein/DNA-binding winged helix-turn-helix (wHTH) protein/Tfp pilus assembly protein PilF